MEESQACPAPRNEGLTAPAKEKGRRTAAAFPRGAVSYRA